MSDDRTQEGSLLDWFVKNSNTIDSYSQLGAVAVVVVFHTKIYELMTNYIVSHFQITSRPWIDFITLHMVIGVFVLAHSVFIFKTVKSLKKSSLKELHDYLNEEIDMRDLFTSKLIKVKKRKKMVIFILVMFILAASFSALDWFISLQKTGSESAALPMTNVLQLITYTCLWIRLPYYLISLAYFTSENAND